MILSINVCDNAEENFMLKLVATKLNESEYNLQNSSVSYEFDVN